MYTAQMELLSTIDAGQKWRYADNNNNALWHIRGVIDNQIIYKVWSKSKRCWKYHTIDEYRFWYLFNDGVLEQV